MARKPTSTAAPKKPAAKGSKAPRRVKTRNYTDEQQAAIKLRVLTEMHQGQSLLQICRADDMPNRETIWRWAALDRKFSEDYERAMQIRADGMFDDILEIADDGTNDWMEVHGEGSAGWKANGEALQRSRLRVDTRKWVLARMFPNKYGDSQTININAAIETRSDDELLKELGEINARLGRAFPAPDDEGK